jgi:hypothetical protein
MKKFSKTTSLMMKYVSKIRRKSEYWTLNTAPLVATLIAASLLSGCMGIYEGGFECPAGTGVGCKSISDVNTMINQGELLQPPAAQVSTTKAEIWYAPRSSVGCSVPGVHQGHAWQMPSHSVNACPSTMERKKGALFFDANSI